MANDLTALDTILTTLQTDLDGLAAGTVSKATALADLAKYELLYTRLLASGYGLGSRNLSRFSPPADTRAAILSIYQAYIEENGGGATESFFPVPEQV